MNATTEDHVQRLLRLVRLQGECAVRTKAAWAQYCGALRALRSRGGRAVAVHPRSPTGSLWCFEVSDRCEFGVFFVEPAGTYPITHPELCSELKTLFERSARRARRRERITAALRAAIEGGAA